MTYKLLSELPDLPENIGSEMFNAIPPETYDFMLMSPLERQFLFGLIRHFKPKNVLEIGVSRGGGAGLMLETIKDMKVATLTSIDLATKVLDKPIGFAALKKNANNPKWTLIPGKDPAEVIESFGKKFDFAIIDTAHFHPIETFNFLSVLPFLEDGAIVVLHDLSLYLHENWAEGLATRYLFTSVTGEKITVSSLDRIENFTWLLPNIGAFQVNSDTHKYIDGVFYSLSIPWAFIPEDRVIDSVRNIIKNHYDKMKLQLFDDAIKANYHLKAKKLLKHAIDLPSVLQQYEGKYILFGEKNAENYIKMIESIGFGLPLEIWDNKVYGGEICGVPVAKPRETLNDRTAIICTVKAKLTYISILEGLSGILKSQMYFFEEL